MSDDAANNNDAGDNAGENKQQSEHLNLKVKAQDGNEVYFKVKRTTQLRKLMDAYCSRVGKEYGSVRFLFDGDRLKGDQTPADLDMEDEDEIDAMVEQSGGARF